MSYGADVISAARRLGSAYVARILKRRPADIPVRTAQRKFDLVINLKTAKTLGLTVPRKLLVTAEKR